MGLTEELGYTYKPPNALQKFMQSLAARRSGSWVFEKTMYRLDPTIFKATGGKHTVPSLLGGLPVIMLTTTGARSGEKRTTPLLAIPVDGQLTLIGSNWGQTNTPAWVYNLEANPEATIAYRARSAAVVAKPADSSQAKEVFDHAARLYPGYAKYRERASHRTIRVFFLEGLPDHD